MRSQAVASRPRRAAKRGRPPGPPRGLQPAPWWGGGPAPHLRWPGVTIEIPTVWSLERARWESRDGRHYFDAEAADWAADFFPTFLRHHIGEFDGQPFDLLDYQRCIVRSVWGWKRAADGFRQFRKVFLAVPKGNGKSMFASGLGLLLAFFDREPSAEVYSVAADKQQARVVFDSAKIMVEASLELSDVCEIYRDSIKLRGQNECYQVLSSDAATKHGFRPHAIIFDEFHAQPNRDLYDALYRGLGKRRQGLLVMITTAGDDDESICFEEWEYARRLIAGTITDEIFLPVVFEARPEEDWTAEATWRRVNPGYGVTVKRDYFETEARAAQNEPRKRNSFVQLHTNRWTNSAIAWVPVERWDACKADPFPGDDYLARLACAAGLDMAQKIDLACFSVVFRDPLETAMPVEVIAETETGEVVKREASLNFRMPILPFFWLPEETLREHERESGISYSAWREAGLLNVTEGAAIDYDRIYSDITTKIVPRFPLLKQGQIGYDPAFATDIANRLRDRAGLTTVEVLQNYKHLSEPCQVFEALVKARRAMHDGNKLLRWNVENVAVKQDDAGRVRPVKPRKSTKKIDGVVATIMGLSRLMLLPEPAEQDYRVEWLA